jgi:ribosomal-protein-serine acetyltransferase
MTEQMPDTLVIDDALRLVMLDSHHAQELFDLVEKNRASLGKWLPWVPFMNSVNDFRNYIRNCIDKKTAGTDYGYLIFWEKQAVGRIGLHDIHHQNKNAAIGYWIDEAFSGKGIVTKACQAIIASGFDKLGLHRIEIKCASGNVKSAAIAERLGFHKEGVLREAEFVNGQFHDLYLYSLLRSDC